MGRSALVRWTLSELARFDAAYVTAAGQLAEEGRRALEPSTGHDVAQRAYEVELAAHAHRQLVVWIATGCPSVAGVLLAAAELMAFWTGLLRGTVDRCFVRYAESKARESVVQSAMVSTRTYWVWESCEWIVKAALAAGGRLANSDAASGPRTSVYMDTVIWKCFVSAVEEKVKRDRVLIRS